jgi:hypothetical protein
MVLVILVVLGAVGLWFLLAFAFKPVGKFLYKIWSDAMEEMNEDSKEDNKKK